MLTPYETLAYSAIGGLSHGGTTSVWIRHGTLANWLGCSVETAGRVARSLIEKELLEFTGERRQGRYKIYNVLKVIGKIVSSNAKNTSTDNVDDKKPSPSKPNPDKPSSKPPTPKKAVDQQQSDRPNKKKEKKQPQEINNVELYQKLIKLRIYPKTAQSLVAKYSEQDIGDQLKHLACLESQSRPPRNIPGWLHSAITRKFPLPEGCESYREEMAHKKRIEKRDAVYQQAKEEFEKGNYDKALELAEKRKLMQCDYHFASADLITKCIDALRDLEKPQVSDLKIAATTKTIAKPAPTICQLTTVNHHGDSDPADILPNVERQIDNAPKTFCPTINIKKNLNLKQQQKTENVDFYKKLTEQGVASNIAQHLVGNCSHEIIGEHLKRLADMESQGQRRNNVPHWLKTGIEFRCTMRNAWTNSQAQNANIKPIEESNTAHQRALEESDKGSHSEIIKPTDNQHSARNDDRLGFDDLDLGESSSVLVDVF